MNIWRRGPLNRNPYYRHAFRLARVSPSTTRRKVIIALIGQTRKVVQIDPQAHCINREPVTLTEINSAEQILLDPRQRILEELLVHEDETLSIEGVRALVTELDETLASSAHGTLRITRLDSLRPLADEILCQFLENTSAGTLSFGALELRIPPPFGWQEED